MMIGLAFVLGAASYGIYRERRVHWAVRLAFHPCIVLAALFLVPA